MLKSGQAWSGLFVTRDSTGALSTPSVGPVGTLYVNGVATLDAVTISGSNPYKFAVTLPTLTAGDCVSMYITATRATIATAAVVAEDVSDTSRLSDGVAVASIAAGAITAAAIATGAVDADALATDAVTEIWAASSRTLTQSAASVTTAVSGTTLTVTRTVSYAATLTGLTISATWSKILLTAKASTSDSDAAAQIQIQESVAGTGDGLLYIDGKTPTVAGLVVGDASLTVDQAAGTIAIVIDDEATALMVSGTYSYDVKCLLADGTSQQLTGNATFTVQDAVTATV
jgi:hypothetical protein